MRVLLQPAFILHRRPYRDSSLLLEALSMEHGRLGLVVRGAAGPRSRLRGLLQPFVPLLLSWSGAGDLVTLDRRVSNSRKALCHPRGLAERSLRQ